MKKFFSVLMAAMIVVSQTPLGVLVGTLPQANAQLDLSAITTVTVTGPTAGAYSNTINVTWTTNEDPENVDISYCQGSSCTIENWSLTPITLAENNDGSYAWDTSSVPNGTGYRIVIARAGFQSPLGLSQIFEVYNADYDDTERRDIVGIGFPDPSPIWTNEATYLTTYITDTITRSSFAWTQQSGPGTIGFSSTTGDTTTASADQDGSYVIRYTATDYAGNTAYDDVTFNRDTTGPTSDDDVQAGWYNGSAYITFTCDDGDGIGCDRVRYALDGAPTVGVSDYVTIVEGEGSVWINNIGTYTLWYMAEDELGNVATAQSGENLLRIEYDYDDPEYRSYVEIYDDEYRYSQFQKGASVDVPTGVLSGAWTMISGPSEFDGENTTYGQITFSDASANPTNIEADMEGEYVIQYEVTTNGGNTYSDTFTLIWDQTNPTSTDDAPAGRQNSPVTVDIDCDDTLGAEDYSGCERIYYSINEGSWNYLDTDYEDFDLYFDQDGTYEVDYYAADRAGNEEYDGEGYNTFTVQIDQTDPSVSINMDWVEGDDEMLYSTGQSENVTITTDDNLSGIATCVWTVEDAQYATTGDISFDNGEDDGCDFMNITAAEPGIYTIRVTVTDEAGNWDYDEFVLYYDDSTPVVQNLNVTVESYNTIDVAGLASNTNGFSPIDVVEYYIDTNGDNPTGYLMLSQENVTQTNFEGDIDVSNLTNGTYTIYVRAITQSAIASNWVSQSFNKVSSPGQLYGPQVLSSTPSNAATHVSVAAGVATITFNQNIDFACHYNGECYNVDIKKVSDNTSVVSGGELGLSWTGNVLSIEYSELEYNTNYVIHIPAYSVAGTNRSWNTQETFIYFSTQAGQAPDITSLGVTNLGSTYAEIFLTSDQSDPYPSIEYRISTVAYSGTWTPIGAGGGYSISAEEHRKLLQDLALGTTYYYQVRLTYQGQTTISVPMSFTTASAENGIIVHNIQRIFNGNTVLANNNYDNGYHFRFFFTVNNLTQSIIDFKLDNWTRPDNATMAVANNAKVVVSEAGFSDHNLATETLTDTEYTEVVNAYDMDANPLLGGRQLYLDLFYKIPTGSQGVYSTSYGIRARDND